ncbi:MULTISPECIES: 2-amino-4-hydroxy-6-hydroxymethyldihydropteridine diphosphokinase [Moorena]|uniref:2-amino-4-hydroxy-6-hydroxymethyldihydropteridine diphosphokinase n=1 Tax=Moorena producens 3L TaxID=489825 RepID=F4Y0N0_9CYAN|nr:MULTISPECIES: 2-amino-4-hydroxy-6-hydroxymethyldihydropteridine diphosphokinase [Moorena]NEQ17946.1 2-amino-4-hydroxy-6-hydroxymethyldihydropteridine diphosphokinase [Moorena sp. SIO3E2]NES86475.1 2-amino-4-hydroxy-6-hydroxymethyldihydropteridine diphosphokinase [Moorena sp. SIO2B7]EGJ29654.1 2-amino-4-hydroxy-6-hydroxymethyldihydropteridine pyrophosphokinase [Moorena producens 3L]NEP33121.1 2-amino-4-hydroxy-6-hydroxymethyldihydropteridine diphosphokinase [Moorena sp. SIO3B2]NEP66222.1 2-a
MNEVVVNEVVVNEVVVSVGSNIEPNKNVKLAKDKLSKIDNFVNESRFYLTKPIGFTDQPDFLNGAFLIHTEDGFETFRQKLKQVEIDQGRVKQEVRPVANLIRQRKAHLPNKNGPRCIDLDIVVWNRRIVDPDFYQRDFIKKTVLELIPDLNV